MVDPFGLLCLKSSFCPCQLFFFCFKTEQPIHKTPRIINGFCFCDSSPIEMTPKMATWKFRSEIPFGSPVVQHSWLICKGIQQKYTRLACLFEGQKESPWPRADGVMMSSCPWCPHHVHVQGRLKMLPIICMPATKNTHYSCKLKLSMGKESNGCNHGSGKCQFLGCMFGVCFFNPLRYGPETLLNICTLHSHTWQQVSACKGIRTAWLVPCFKMVGKAPRTQQADMTCLVSSWGSSTQSLFWQRYIGTAMVSLPRPIV